jgi:hypothetical protein
LVDELERTVGRRDELRILQDRHELPEAHRVVGVALELARLARQDVLLEARCLGPPTVARGIGLWRAKSAEARFPPPGVSLASSTRWHPRQFIPWPANGPGIVPADVTSKAVTGSPSDSRIWVAAGAREVEL